MDSFVSLSASHFPHTPTTLLTRKHHQHHAATATAAVRTSLSFSLKPPPPPPPPPKPTPPESHNLRRLPISTQPTPNKNPKNPLRNLLNSTTTLVPSPPSDSLSAKLRLTSKLSPPPTPLPPPTPPPPPQLQEPQLRENEIPETDDSSSPSSSSLPSQRTEFRQEGKIFVGNLPNWIKKHQVMELFRQFGPIKNVILIKGYNDFEKNMGFGFVLYDGPEAEKSAMKAVEFDGIEFHGRVLTVKLDDGSRMKNKTEERARWVAGVNEEEFKSLWHKERERHRWDFRKVVETQPENWQAVVGAFERIKKVI